jgi:hypothetical protein
VNKTPTILISKVFMVFPLPLASVLVVWWLPGSHPVTRREFCAPPRPEAGEPEAGAFTGGKEQDLCQGLGAIIREKLGGCGEKV